MCKQQLVACFSWISRYGDWLFVYRRTASDCVYAVWRVIFRSVHGRDVRVDFIFIQTNTVTSESIFVSLPIAILVGAINLSNNIRDIEEDTKGDDVR